MNSSWTKILVATCGSSLLTFTNGVKVGRNISGEDAEDRIGPADVADQQLRVRNAALASSSVATPNPVPESWVNFLNAPEDNIINVVYVFHGLGQEPARMQHFIDMFENRDDVVVFSPTHQTSVGDFVASARHLHRLMVTDIDNLIKEYPADKILKISCAGFSLGGPASMGALVGIEGGDNAHARG